MSISRKPVIHPIVLPPYNQETLPLDIQTAIKIPTLGDSASTPILLDDKPKIISLIESDMSFYSLNALETMIKQLRLSPSSSYTVLGNPPSSGSTFQALRVQQARLYSLYQLEKALSFHYR